VGLTALNGGGVVYQGMTVFGAGAVLAGLVLGAIAVFIIDREYTRAIVYSLFGALLAFVGLIHDPAGLIYNTTTGAFRAPTLVWVGYLFMAGVVWVVAWREGRATAADFRAAVTEPPPAAEAMAEG
jgi:AGZA family xanthine/uracil permease-like MFS transporter